jgi:hypothetical protein
MAPQLSGETPEFTILATCDDKKQQKKKSAVV